MPKVMKMEITHSSQGANISPGLIKAFDRDAIQPAEDIFLFDWGERREAICDTWSIALVIWSAAGESLDLGMRVAIRLR